MIARKLIQIIPQSITKQNTTVFTGEKYATGKKSLHACLPVEKL